MNELEEISKELAGFGAKIDHENDITKSTNEKPDLKLKPRDCKVITLPSGRKVIVCPI